MRKLRYYVEVGIEEDVWVGSGTWPKKTVEIQSLCVASEAVALTASGPNMCRQIHVSQVWAGLGMLRLAQVV